MQIVIDVPEEYYKAITEIPNHQCTSDMLIIKNGIPLPKRHGEWLEREGEIDGTFHCSVCDEWVVWDDINHAYTYNFCPWCGADMREEVEV